MMPTLWEMEAPRGWITVSRPHSQSEANTGFAVWLCDGSAGAGWDECQHAGGRASEAVNTTTVAHICGVLRPSAVQESPYRLPTTNLQGDTIFISTLSWRKLRQAEELGRDHEPGLGSRQSDIKVSKILMWVHLLAQRRWYIVGAQ